MNISAWSSPKLRSDYTKYFIAIICMGFAAALVDSTFNNYLKVTWDIGGRARSALELPREIPGVLNVFVAAALAFLPSRRIAAVAFVLQTIGILLIGLISPTFFVMTCWLFIYSLGQHVFLPLQQSVGMELSKAGGEGALLGKMNAMRNVAQLLGAAFVFIAFGVFHFNFHANFVLAAIILIGGACALFSMSTPPQKRAPTRLVFKKRYTLFYVLSILFGTRKQLFLTFAPWVVVSVYAKPTSVVAALYLAGGAAGVIFQPLIGRAVDRMGERFMLGLEAIILIPVCLLYGLARFIFPENIAFAVVCVCYVLDSLLVSFGMARSIWLKKTAEKTEDIAPTLAMGVSLDHVFAIGVALIAGVLWDLFGYQWVFISGTLIAIINFIATRWVHPPRQDSPSGTLFSR